MDSNFGPKEHILACSNSQEIPESPSLQSMGPSLQVTAMPFGLNIAPKVFTKLCSVRIKELHLKGIKIFANLDDWIVWASSCEHCLQDDTEV